MMLSCSARGGGGWAALILLASALWPALSGVHRNTISLVSPNGTQTSWWTPGSVGPWQPRHVWHPSLRLPLKVRITKRKGPTKPISTFPHTYATAASAPTSATHSKGPCPNCGTSIVTSNRGHNQIGPWHGSGQKGFLLWPWSVSSNINITLIEKGIPNTSSFYIFFQNEDGPISPFHDIPLFANEGNKIFNMVVEVPRWTNAKMEIATKEPLNPIRQDVKKGKLRYVANVFPHHGYIWNYGALPQTWEDPDHMDDATGCKGDNDPIDVCEIGYRVAKRGEVLQVKVLGTIALIDEGETDWKLIAIDVNDPLAPQLSDITDVEKHMPGFLKATVEWFKIYKIPDGKPENQFAFNGEAKDREFAHRVILETHKSWQALVRSPTNAGGLNTSCVTIPVANSKMTGEEAEEVVNNSPKPGPSQPVDPKVDLWHYVTLK